MKKPTTNASVRFSLLKGMISYLYEHSLILLGTVLLLGTYMNI